LHRKNALFYRTLNGAQVGDLYMSLIHTCQLCGVNSFDYMVELQQPRPGTGRLSHAVDAMELSRDSGAPRFRLALRRIPAGQKGSSAAMRGSLLLGSSRSAT
jgi:hypothetical protein